MLFLGCISYVDMRGVCIEAAVSVSESLEIASDVVFMHSILLRRVGDGGVEGLYVKLALQQNQSTKGGLQSFEI